MIVLDLVYKLALLVVFSIISGFISGKYSPSSSIHKILQGLLFGIASCIGMYHPFIMEEGIIFDGRSILISLCTLFFGLEAGLINSVMAIAYRLYLGGSGVVMGSMVIISSFLIGLFFHYRRLKLSDQKLTGIFLYLFGISVHIVMLVLITTLPGKYILQTYKSLALTVIGIYPVITLLIGKILNAFRENRKFIEHIKELNRELEKKVENRTAQLKETNKELEAYTYTISHDLRAPLRAIDGFLNYLDEDHSKYLDEEGKNLIRIIRQNSNRMGQLIDDLLQFSKFNSIRVKPVQVDMQTLVNQIFNELSRAYPSVPEFKCDKLANIECDESLIRQVWINLISNALKYSKGIENPFIHVGYHMEKNMGTYYIRDNGVGFDMNYVGKLFGVFQRLHSSNEFEGTGVGLAIVKRIIERMGGKVWAEGAVLKGATFYFSLPSRN